MKVNVTADNLLLEAPPKYTIHNPPSGRIPGNLAIWAAIFAELTEFAIMFICIFLVKVYYPETFAQGVEQVNTLAGMFNTFALLSSSYFVAKAVLSVRKNKINTAIRWLWLSIVSALLYLAIKYWEYHWNLAQGYTLESSVFFTAYYYITFNHILHVIWGGCALGWGIYQLKSKRYNQKSHEGLETIASYWHMIDLVWILIFPLLYVLH